MGERVCKDRRTFLKSAATVAAAATVAGCEQAPRTGKRYGMVIDLQKCIGCNTCAVACKAENHTPPGVSYMVVLEEEIGEYPNVRRRFIPRPCMQCEKPSCTMVCPTAATYTRDDGVTVIDYDKCIGCRYCITACPYGARSFDFGHDYATACAHPAEKAAGEVLASLQPNAYART
ncbi:MAG: 4Fe-4S dicluster domain-containing protein, partial [Planctomycetota bacterium]